MKEPSPPVNAMIAGVGHDIIPQAPKEVDGDALALVQSSAREIADKIAAAPDDLQILSGLTRIGDEAQKQVNAFLEMRRVTVGEMMKKVSDGTHNPLPRHIKQLRGILEKFDPRSFRDQLALAQQYGGKGLKAFFLRKIRGVPVLGDMLRRIADQFQPISREIDNLLMAMEGGLVRLDENTAAIMTQSDELKRLIAEVALRSYQAELVFAALKARHAAAAPELAPKVLHAMSRVGKRAFFLRGNEQIFLQVLIGLRTSITTNFELRDTVAMMRDQAAPLLTNLYALIVAQQDARQIAEAAAATQEMVTDLLRSGAEMTRDNVEYVGNLAVKMMNEMDKLIESKNIFLEAVAKAEQIAANTVAAAEKGIPVLQQASEELRKAVAAQEGAASLDHSS